MGYTIEYDSFALKTNTGYTIFWLAGSSNCTESRYGLNGRVYERLDREWGFWGPCDQSLVDAPADAIMAVARSLTGGTYQEHWCRRTRGNWVDDACLLRWAESRIKNAVTLEALLRANNLAFLSVNLTEYKSGLHYTTQRHLERDVHTGDEFSQWVKDAKAFLATAAGKSVYMCVDGLPVDGFVRPSKTKVVSPDEKFFIKVGRNYVTEYELEYDDNGHQYVRGYTMAQAETVKSGKYKPEMLSIEEAEKLRDLIACRVNPERRKSVKVVSAKSLDAAKAADARRVFVVQHPNGWYVTRRTRSGLSGTWDMQHAQHFTDKDAETFVNANMWVQNGPLVIRRDPARDVVTSAL